MLGSFDTLLSPTFGVCISSTRVIVEQPEGDPGDESELAAADRRESRTNVLTSPSLDPVASKANFMAASECGGSQMLMLLGNACTIDTAVQSASM